MEKKTEFAMAMLVVVYWALIFIIPFAILLRGAALLHPATLFPLGIVSYFLFTGYRAWRKGWKTRFILCVAVPAALLLVSSLATAVIAWNG